MTLRFSERYLMALNLLLIALMAYFLALSANDIIRGRLAGGAPLHIPAAGEAAASASYPRAYYDAIVKRDIFNLEPAPETPSAEVATNLHIKLVGTSQLTLSRPFIIVQDDANQRQSLYRLGDEIPDAGKLVGVYKDHAIILHQGRRIQIEMPTQPGAPVSPATGAPALFGPPGNLMHPFFKNGGVHRLGPDRYIINRSTFNHSLSNMTPLFTQIRAVPNIGPDGRSSGFTLSEIQPGSLFQQMGLQDGDVLTSVGGQPVSDPAKAMELLTSLRNQSAISLTVMRGGQPVHLQYNVR